MMDSRKRLQRYAASALLLLALAACQVERPDTVLSDEKMEKVLYDYHIAKALGEDLPFDENYKKVLYVESAFRKHGITEEQFDSSMVWFARYPEILSKVYERVNARLKGEKETLENLIAKRNNRPRTSEAGDSIDVWAWQRLYQLSGMPMDNKMTFALPSDSNFQERDTLCWKLHVSFQGADFDSVSAPVMAMQIQYKNDSIVSGLRKIYKAGDYALVLQGDTLGMLKEVTGFVYYPEQKVERPLLLSQISLMRYHSTDTLGVVARKDTATIKKDNTPEKESVPQKQKEKVQVETVKNVPSGRPRPTSVERNVPKQTLRPVQNKLKLNSEDKKLRK